MLAKKYQVIVIFFLAILSNLIYGSEFERSCKNVCDQGDWAHHGSFYLTGGYVFTHTLFTNNLLSITPPGQPTIFFTPKSAFPNDCSGIRLGFGSGLGTNTPFYYELDYNQIFTCSKIRDGLQVSRASKSLVTTLGFSLNPKSRLRVVLFGGATVASVYTTLSTVRPRPPFSQKTNTVDVDPFAGGSLVYQVNSKLAVRVVEFFDISTYNPNARGTWVTLLMLNYYPS